MCASEGDPRDVLNLREFKKAARQIGGKQVVAIEQMSLHQAFNASLKGFVEDLSRAFPEERALSTFLATFDSLTVFDETAMARMFMEAVGPHVGLVRDKDPRLFGELHLPNIDLKKVWESGISEATKEAIWKHMGVLVFLGSTIQSIPEDMLKSIETLAASCAEKLQSGQLDMGSLTAMLMGGMGGDGALGGLGGLGGLAGLAGMGGLGGLGGLALEGNDVDADADADADVDADADNPKPPGAPTRRHAPTPHHHRPRPSSGKRPSKKR